MSRIVLSPLEVQQLHRSIVPDQIDFSCPACGEWIGSVAEDTRPDLAGGYYLIFQEAHDRECSKKISPPVISLGNFSAPLSGDPPIVRDDRRPRTEDRSPVSRRPSERSQL